MKNRVTKKHIQELLLLIKTQGYWSESVREYLSQFEYNARCRLDTRAKALFRMERVD